MNTCYITFEKITLWAKLIEIYVKNEFNKYLKISTIIE